MILLIGILLASTAVFCMMIGEFSWQNMVIGASISLALMYIFRRQINPKPLPPVGLSVHLLLYAPVLFYYLFIDIMRGTYQVSMITLGLHPLRRPGIVKIPFETHSPHGVGPIGFFITLSPGSFLVDVDWDDKIMYVHVIDASDPEAIRREAEKYYRLWEYGEYQPRAVSQRPATRLEDDDDE